MTPTDLAWAAGIIEGEGYIGIGVAGPRTLGALVLAVSNTDHEMVAWLQARWGGSLVPMTGQVGNRKPAWVWTIAALRAAECLGALQPYLVTSRVRAKVVLALEYQAQKTTTGRNRTQAYREEQAAYYLAMKRLNRRGVAL